MDIWEDWDHPLLSSDLPPGTLHLSGSPPRSGCHKRALLRKAWRTWGRRTSQVPLAQQGDGVFVVSMAIWYWMLRFTSNLFRRCLCLQNSLLASITISEVIKKVCQTFMSFVLHPGLWIPELAVTTVPGNENQIPTTQKACFIPSYSYLSMRFCISHNFQGLYFLLGCPPRINLFCWNFWWRSLHFHQGLTRTCTRWKAQDLGSCAYLLSFLWMTIYVSIDSKVYVHILSICIQYINKEIHIIHKYMVMQCIYVYVLFLLLFRKPSKSVVTLAPLCNKNPCYLPT